MATPIEVLLGMHADPTSDPADVARALRNERRTGQALALSTIGQVADMGRRQENIAFQAANRGGVLRRQAQARADEMARQEIMDERYAAEQEEGRRRWEAGQRLRGARLALQQRQFDAAEQRADERLAWEKDKFAQQLERDRNKIETQAAARRDKKLDKMNAAMVQSRRGYAQMSGNIETGIQAIDDGAMTGVIPNMLLTLRESTARLENVQQRMGLDELGKHSLGSVSNKEGDWVKGVGLDLRQDPRRLRAGLVKRLEAVERLKKVDKYTYEQQKAGNKVDPERVDEILYGDGFSFRDPSTDEIGEINRRYDMQRRGETVAEPAAGSNEAVLSTMPANLREAYSEMSEAEKARTMELFMEMRNR